MEGEDSAPVGDRKHARDYGRSGSWLGPPPAALSRCRHGRGRDSCARCRQRHFPGQQAAAVAGCCQPHMLLVLVVVLLQRRGLLGLLGMRWWWHHGGSKPQPAALAASQVAWRPGQAQRSHWHRSDGCAAAGGRQGVEAQRPVSARGQQHLPGRNGRWRWRRGRRRRCRCGFCFRWRWWRRHVSLCLCSPCCWLTCLPLLLVCVVIASSSSSSAGSCCFCPFCCCCFRYCGCHSWRRRRRRRRRWWWLHRGNPAHALQLAGMPLQPQHQPVLPPVQQQHAAICIPCQQQAAAAATGTRAGGAACGRCRQAGHGRSLLAARQLARLGSRVCEVPAEQVAGLVPNQHGGPVAAQAFCKERSVSFGTQTQAQTGKTRVPQQGRPPADCQRRCLRWAIVDHSQAAHGVQVPQAQGAVCGCRHQQRRQRLLLAGTGGGAAGGGSGSASARKRHRCDPASMARKRPDIRSAMPCACAWEKPDGGKAPANPTPLRSAPCHAHLPHLLVCPASSVRTTLDRVLSSTTVF